MRSSRARSQRLAHRCSRLRCRVAGIIRTGVLRRFTIAIDLAAYGVVTLADVMTVRLRHPGLSLVLLVLAGALAVGWWRLSTPVFTILAIYGCHHHGPGPWGPADAFHQTQPDELASRGIYPDDRSLPVYDPGLRRDCDAHGLGVRQPADDPQAHPAGVRPSGAARPRRSSRRPALEPPPLLRRARGCRARAASRPAPPAGRAARAGRHRQLRRAAAGSGRRGPVRRPGPRADRARPREEEGRADRRAAPVDRARQRFGLTASRPNLHMCFTGAPGTGKTTVALMMADLLHRLGYLEHGPARPRHAR